MTKFYLMMIIPNPWLDLDAASSNSEQEVMPHTLAESEQPGADLRSDHPSDNAPPSSYEAGAPVPSDLDALDCIAEIFAGHAKSDRRFTLNAAKFELALIDPPPLRNVA